MESRASAAGSSWALHRSRTFEKPSRNAARFRRPVSGSLRDSLALTSALRSLERTHSAILSASRGCSMYSSAFSTGPFSVTASTIFGAVARTGMEAVRGFSLSRVNRVRPSISGSTRLRITRPTSRSRSTCWASAALATDTTSRSGDVSERVSCSAVSAAIPTNRSVVAAFSTRAAS